jgi:PAS domain S-box-containing protein
MRGSAPEQSASPEEVVVIRLAMKILIVDDNLTDRKRLRAQLEAEGHVVVDTAGGVEYGQELIVKMELKIAELSAAVERLQASEERLEAIVRTEPECVKIISPEGRLLEMNPAGLGMLDAESVEVLCRRPLLDLVAPAYREAFSRLHQEVMAGGRGILEFEAIGLKGRRCWLEMHAAPLRNRQGKIVSLLGITHDITERKLAEAESKRRHAELQIILDAVPALVFYKDRDGRFLRVNRELARLVGVPPEAFVGKTDAEMGSPDAARYRQDDLQVIASGKPLRRLEERLHGADGVRWLITDKVPYRDQNGIITGIIGFAVDITERKRAEEALHELSGRLLRLQDEERRRIARELHDTTAQNLAALAMNLSVLGQAGAGADEPWRKLLGDCERLVDRSVRELRTSAYLLHPPLLEQVGLVRAMRDYAEGFAQRSGVRVELDLADALGRLPDAAELALFRVLQESLANVHRHSGSPTAGIHFAGVGGEVVLEVRDAGRGLGGRALDDGMRLGVGIAGMRERLRQLGGRLEIESESPGTLVRAVLPWEKRDA